MIRSIAVGVAAWACVSAASAQQVLRTFSWSELRKSGALLDGEVRSGSPSAPQEQLRIESPSGKPKTMTLLDLSCPRITSFRYGVEGEVRYENVKAKSYLEMWSWFANGEKYFTRTLGSSGAMGAIAGSSDWRRFALPFSADRRMGLPVRITVNLVLGDGGTVELRPVRLLHYQNDWWSEWTGALIGSVGGSILGSLGALVGVLAGLGKARRITLALTTATAVAGATSLVLGAIALAIGQPYEVYYPLLLGGFLGAAVFGGLLPVVRRHYAQIELRKMAAMDAA